MIDKGSGWSVRLKADEGFDNKISLFITDYVMSSFNIHKFSVLRDEWEIINQ